MVMEARCIWDEDWEIHGDPWWWNGAHVAGQRDQGSIDPRKYFDEEHDAWNGYGGFNVIDYTRIEFFSDVYNYTWTNNDKLSKSEDYTYWVGRVDTRIRGDFRNIGSGAHWIDIAWASIASRGYPE